MQLAKLLILKKKIVKGLFTTYGGHEGQVTQTISIKFNIH